MSATHNLTAGGQLQAGETVTVYLARHVGGAVIDTQTLSSLSTATLEGLEWDTEYAVVGATSGRTVRFRTPVDPDLATFVVNVRNHGALGDGSNEYAALQSALYAAAGGVCYFPPPEGEFYGTLTKLVVPENTLVLGDDGGDYWGPGVTRIIKTNGDTDGNCVFEVNAGAKFRGVAILAPDAPYFLASIYPTRPNNPSYGIYPAGGDGVEGLEIDRCWIAYFKLAGIGGGTAEEKWEVPQIRSTYFVTNLYGIDWIANDVRITGGAIRHSVASGYRNGGGGVADSFDGTRIEWNACYGIESAGRLSMGGAYRVEHNGWAGVNLVSGAWGCVLGGGGEFYRNGCGGDSERGRTDSITTSATDPDGNIMYLAPPAELDKAHIRADGVKYCVSMGARLVAGSEDGAGAGARAPKYAYGLKDVGEFIVMNQDRLGWWQDHADLGSLGAYRDGAGARTREEGSVTKGGIEWQDSLAVFPGVAYTPSYLQTAGGGGSSAGLVAFGSDAGVQLYRNNSTQATLRSNVPLTLPTYTTATKPAAANVPAGTLIFVSDGGAGAVVQVSTGAAWVNVG